VFQASFFKHRGTKSTELPDESRPPNPANPIRTSPSLYLFPSASPTPYLPSTSFFPSPCPLCLCVSNPTYPGVH
jgi:hypothetical protein